MAVALHVDEQPSDHITGAQVFHLGNLGESGSGIHRRHVVVDAVPVLEFLRRDLFRYTGTGALEHVFDKCHAIGLDDVIRRTLLAGHPREAVLVGVLVVLGLGVGGEVAGQLQVPRD